MSFWPLTRNDKTKTAFQWNADFGDSDRIQTCNLLIRSQMLYSVELRSRVQFPAISLFANLSAFLLLDTSLLTSEFAEIEDACTANLTYLVELD